MDIRWRLGVAGFQILLLLTTAELVVGKAITTDIWFAAGLFAVVVNPQLLEPYYTKPVDVIANAVVFLFLFAQADVQLAKPGWIILASAFSIAALLAIFGLVGGKGANSSTMAGLARAARSIAPVASSRVIYSSVFFLDLFRFRPNIDLDFWILSGAWLALMLIGAINWQKIWTTVSVPAPEASIEGWIGPAMLTITSAEMPAQGTPITLVGSSFRSDGVVVKRIHRKDGIWAQVHLQNAALCEQFLREKFLRIELAAQKHQRELAGSVDQGSTDVALNFMSVRSLEVGQIVSVPKANGKHIYYQLSGATIERTKLQDDSHDFVQAIAQQVGIFDETSLAFKRHLWTPPTGAPVFSGAALGQLGAPKQSQMLLGHLLGTQLPIFIDVDAACEGHVAILGMTKMGKSTLAERLARRLSQTRFVTVLDLTGEWVGKKGFPKLTGQTNQSIPGISIFEPKVGDVPAARALECLKFIAEKGRAEYLAGSPFPRAVIIDEAHQFIPEPAGLGFNAPGRDQSYEIGLLLMQIRKFGISVTLISQRTAVVAKSALSQCENVIAFRSVDQTGLDYLEAIGGDAARALLPKLTHAQAIAIGPAMTTDAPVAIAISQ